MNAVPTVARPPAARAVLTADGQRTDIQGLRAIAVCSVVLFHLWPHRLTGGYVGVDVFLVISGFLITGHLLRRPVAGPGDLARFWARRVRRLIPAATVVLLATLVAGLVWLPATVRQTLGREVVASALYAENWVLAWTATDYLAADELHSPVQHFWSLSVEEQFYIVWPVLIGLAVWAARRRRAAWVPFAVVGGVTSASLAWSWHETAVNPSAAYFVSTTRFWELGVGGLVAVLAYARPLRLPAVVRAALAWAGLAMIAVAVVRFDATTPFPGVAALVPTLGTALVIVAVADPVPSGPGRFLALRPMQWLGGISYSTYLWHWPLVVLLPFVMAEALTWPAKLGIAGASVVLAQLTKVLVEDPLRFHPALRARTARTFGVLVVCLVLTAGSGIAVHQKASADERAAQALAQQRMDAAADCLGAAATRNPSCDHRAPLVTEPAFAKKDKSDAYPDDCWNNTPFRSRTTCHYGPDGATTHIALLGNSHAGHWLPAIQEVLGDQDWDLTTYLQSICYPADVPLELPGEGDSERCRETNRWAVGAAADGDYDLVVMSSYTFTQIVGVSAQNKDDVARDAYRKVLAQITATGTPVLVLRDTPAMGRNVPDCVAEHLDDPAACDRPLGEALGRDALAEAARLDTTGLVSVLDVNDLICPKGTCRAVVGGVITFFDHGHLTATFAKTLQPEIEAAMVQRLRDGA